MEKELEAPSYGSWVSKKLIIRMLVMLAIVAAAATGAYFIPQLLAVAIILTVSAVFFLKMAVYFLAARYALSDSGGGVQGKVLDLLFSYLPAGDFKNVLDVGCGSGALTVKIAKKFPSARVVGIDNWQGNWGYSIAQCQNNARLEGVVQRTEFLRGTASHLNFPDGSFDLVVSNLTFHEVRNAKNKWDVVAEALRVLKPGGTFVFQDLFLIRSIYGKREGLADKMRSLGVRKVDFVDTSGEEFIARLLRLSFMLGKIGILHGEK